MHRRLFLLGGGLAAACHLPRDARAEAPPAPRGEAPRGEAPRRGEPRGEAPRGGNAGGEPRRLLLRHGGTGARFDGPWHDGTAPDPVAMAELSAVLADAGVGPPRPFDPDAIAILWEVAARTRLGTEIRVNSGYRSPGVNRAAHGAGDSLHLRAAALDVDVPAGRLPAVAAAAVALGRGGVGVYARRGFIHLDSGPVRHWREGAARAAAPPEDRVGTVAAAWGRR